MLCYHNINNGAQGLITLHLVDPSPGKILGCSTCSEPTLMHCFVKLVLSGGAESAGVMRRKGFLPLKCAAVCRVWALFLLQFLHCCVQTHY